MRFDTGGDMTAELFKSNTAFWRRPAPKGDRRPPEYGTAQAGGDRGVKKRIQAEGGEPMTSTPEEHAKAIDIDEKRWSAWVRKLGLKVD